MAFNTSECQRVQGAIATEEYIAFDSEDDNNQNARNGSYPFGAGGRNHRVYYCYYEGKGLMSVFVQLPSLNNWWQVRGWSWVKVGLGEG